MDCSMPGYSQAHIHWVSDAVQPSQHLVLPSPPALKLSQHQALFQWVGSLHQMAKILELQHPIWMEYSGLISFRINWFDILAVQETLKSLPQHHSSKASVMRLIVKPRLESWGNTLCNLWGRKPKEHPRAISGVKSHVNSPHAVFRDWGANERSIPNPWVWGAEITPMHNPQFRGAKEIQKKPYRGAKKHLYQKEK